MDVDAFITLAVAILLLLVCLLPYFWIHRRREQHAEQVFQKSIDKGLEEPETLHPVIDPNACVCTGNCVAACPEEDVLGLLSGTALAVNPTKCVGHGLCERVCPMEAIQLVVGTSQRGVDIPRIQENFETNVPGMFVIGELGGMGLIRNAFEQARQCVEGIAAQSKRTRETRQTPADVLDVLIVGCGPAGLGASLHCKDKGLRFITIEKEDIGGTVRYYPRKKLVMTAPVDIPGYGRLKIRDIVKEDLISLWQDIVEKTELARFIHTQEAMLGARQNPGGYFTIETSKGTYNAQHVVLAIGRRGMPRKLGVPGEKSSNVAFSLLEPEHYAQHKLFVVGGGDSAVECALALAEQPGSQVSLSYRKAQFSRIKEDNYGRIQAAIAKGDIRFLPESNLQSISANEVTYIDDAGIAQVVSNDYVFVMIGGTLPAAMLRELGIQIDTKFGEPLWR